MPAQTNNTQESPGMIGYDQIRALLPYGDCFVMVDRVLELEPKKRILCLKNVSGTDGWFRGHFPDVAIMPGIILLETIAQSALILFIKSVGGFDNRVGVLRSVKANFLIPVKPGDQLTIEVVIDKMISRGGVISALITVDGKKVASGGMTFGVVEKQILHT